MKLRSAIFAMLFIFTAVTGFSAASDVKVSGNLADDGYLIIDIDWIVDTSKYPKVQRQDLKRTVYDEIWTEALPKIVQKSGDIASCEKASFTKISENKKLIKQRPDGTKVYDYDAKVKFECGGKVNRVSDRDFGMPTQKYFEGYHDGFTDEADSF